MSTKPATPEPWTAGQVFECVPVGWLGAEINIASTSGYLTDVRRVSLQTNHDGSRLVVIHPNPSK